MSGEGGGAVGWTGKLNVNVFHMFKNCRRLLQTSIVLYWNLCILFFFFFFFNIYLSFKFSEVLKI